MEPTNIVRPTDYRILMRDALCELERLQSRVDEFERKAQESIAIIGMDCRFPGHVTGPSSFWSLLTQEKDAIMEVPADRWDADTFYDPDPQTPGKMVTRFGGFLDGIDQFDPGFFWMSPREAASTDPQHRLALEVAWGALENAGVAGRKRDTQRTGVFLGITTCEYAHLLLRAGTAALGPYFTTGACLNAAAGRISYLLGLRGPSLVVDTACSSSLVAVHLACQSLRAQECNQALAGGVNVILLPEVTIATSRAHMLAPDGRCKAFDARANGYVRSEGCGVVVLKRLSDALAQRDQILAVIRGSAVNQDGASGGLTVPSAPAQEQVIRSALKAAGVPASAVSYVEAHGTGTQLGDPIEIRALNSCYGVDRPREAPLIVGAVKTNIGHAESAAGIAGLIKLVLSLKHERIPANLHFETPSNHIPWSEFAVEVASSARPWLRMETPRIGAVSSFGFSGTNCHMIIGEAPCLPRSGSKKSEPHPQLFTLSATCESSLRLTAQEYRARLEDVQSVPEETGEITFGDICYTASMGREHRKHRLATVALSTEEACAQLAHFVDKGADPAIAKGEIGTGDPQVAFLFTGQGAQHLEMGRELFETQSTFREAFEQCDALLRSDMPIPLIDVVFPKNKGSSSIHETAFAQPALFSLGYSLACLWQSWGIVPRFLLGHSIGEYTAACVAGVVSLSDGLKLVAERGRLMQAVAESGGMAAVAASQSIVSEAVGRIEGELCVAAINGPSNTVISGPTRALDAALGLFGKMGIRSQRLQVSHAFHSPLMAPVASALLERARSATWSQPNLQIISTVTGKPITDEFCQPGYWGSQVLLPVNFAGAMRSLSKDCRIFVEIGPSSTLLQMGRSCLDATDALWLPSLRPRHSDWRQMLESLAQLYVRGASVDWNRLHADGSYRRVALPKSPIKRSRHWIDSVAPTDGPTGRFATTLAGSGSRFVDVVDLPDMTETRFEAQYDSVHPAYLTDHRLDDVIVVPAASHIALTLFAGERCALPVRELRDLMFPQALVLRDDESARVHLKMGENSVFQVYGRRTSKPDNDHSWTIHAEGSFRTQISAGNVPSRIDLEQLRKHARFDRRITRTEFYDTFRSRGYTLGPAFQWIDEIWLCNSEVLCRLERPVLQEELDGYPLHPGLIDSCFQVLAAGAEPDVSHGDTIHVPFRINRFCYFELPRGARLWCHVERREVDGAVVRGDIHLIDEDGRSIALIEGLEARAIPRAELVDVVSRHDRERIFYYEVEWRPTQAVASVTELDGTWLVLADDGELGVRLAKQIRHLGARCLLAAVPALDGESNFAASDCDTITLRNLRHLHKVVPDLGAKLRGVVYLRGLAECVADLTPAALMEYQQRRCGGAVEVVQSLMAASATSRLWLVTRGANAVGGDRCVHVQESPLWGLGQVVASELPELRCTRIDLDPTPGADDVADLLAEIASPDEEQSIAYRGGLRHMMRVVPRALNDLPMRASGLSTSPSIRGDGLYLVTGAFGSLGERVASWLVDQGARNLVLVGRHAPQVDAQERVQALERAGARVLSLQADVADQDDMAALIKYVKAQPVPLRGVIHAAGVLDDCTLATLNWERLARVQAPKVAGGWNLHLATRDLPLDFFVTFSSAAVWLGPPAQGGYVSANAFLDALANHRRNLGLAATTINWGPWAGGGMAARLDRGALEKLNRRGVRLLPAEKALEALDAILARDVTQVGVLSIRGSKSANDAQFEMASAAIRPLYPQGATQVDRTNSKLRSALLAADAETRRTLLREHVTAQVAQVLGFKEGRVDPKDVFFELGMDSLSAIELRNSLQVSLQCYLPSTLAFNYPSVNELVEGVLKEVAELSSESRPETSEMLVSTVRGRPGNELESIIDDELHRLLSRDNQ